MGHFTVSREERGCADLEVRHDDAPVERVRDAPAIHALSDEVAQRAPWDRLVVVCMRFREVAAQPVMRATPAGLADPHRPAIAMERPAEAEEEGRATRAVRAEQRHAHAEVGLVEVIRNVPADLAVLAPLLHDRVEERQAVHDGAERGVRTRRQLLLADLRVAAQALPLSVPKSNGPTLHQIAAALGRRGRAPSRNRRVPRADRGVTWHPCLGAGRWAAR